MSREWFVIEQHFDAHPYPYHVYMDTMVKEFPKVFGDGLRHIFIFFENGHFKQMFDKEDWRRISASATAKLNDLKFAQIVAANSRKGITDLFKISEKIGQTNLDGVTNSQLADLLEGFNYAFTFAGAWGVVISAAEYEYSYGSKKILEIIQKRNLEANINEVFEAVTYWPEATFVYREKEDLLKIADAMKQKKLAINSLEVIEELKKHAKKYEWISFAFQGPVLDKEYFSMALADVVKSGATLEVLKTEEEKKKKQREYYLEQLKLSSEERKTIDTLAELFYLKALRKDAEYYSNYVLWGVFKEFAKRFEFSINQARFLLASEIIKALRTGEINREELGKRTKRFVFLYEDCRFSTFSGDDAQQFRKLLPHEEVPEIKELNGEVASKGVARGVVRIVLSKEDYSKFNEGEILASVATNPNMVPLMKKAAAIITDVGGLTCHAAIVSRELGKPCVIGTRIATRALKDGDLIEVDAVKGIVKKL